MISHIDLQGASGTIYRFRSADDPRAKTPMSGNYVYIRVVDDQFEVIYAANADNLLTDARNRWAEAVAKYAATDIFIRLNVAQSVRRNELEDLLQAVDPPMNHETAETGPA
jgi:hypothetical protein